MNPTLFDTVSSMRSRRIDYVKQVLRDVPLARKDAKTLLIETWKLELQGKCLCEMHIKFGGSSPEGILRDRRRVEVLKEFPRDEKKFEQFQEYKAEFSPQAMSWLDRAD